MSLGTLTIISIAFLVVFIQNAEKINNENLDVLSETTINFAVVDVQKTLGPAMDMVKDAASQIHCSVDGFSQISSNLQNKLKLFRV